MQSTMNLLDAALAKEAAPYWTEKLRLSRGALHTAKTRGHLSPAIAGALAKVLGEPVEKWICIAALESEKDSACKTMLVKEAGRSWLHSSLVKWFKAASTRLARATA
jgi:hypothetical protein